MTQQDPDDGDVFMELVPRGLFSRDLDIMVDGAVIGSCRQRAFARRKVSIELNDGECLEIMRRGFFRPHYELVLGGTEQVLARAEPSGIIRMTWTITIGDSVGTLRPSPMFGFRREYERDGQVVARSGIRGAFKRGFIVRARPEVPQAEMLFLGWIADFERQQRAAAASS